MSNHSNNANLISFFVTELNERTLINLFNIDSDFTENEDCFREDTLELGFENEAERCSKEIFDKYSNLIDKHTKTEFRPILEKMLEEAFAYDNDNTIFLIGSDTYCGDYTYNIMEYKENEFIVNIAYVG